MMVRCFLFYSNEKHAYAKNRNVPTIVVELNDKKAIEAPWKYVNQN